MEPKAFDATRRPGLGYMLNFFRWEGDQSVTHGATKGRVYDHVGFEVRNLQEFCTQLEAKGVKPSRSPTVRIRR